MSKEELQQTVNEQATPIPTSKQRTSKRLLQFIFAGGVVLIVILGIVFFVQIQSAVEDTARGKTQDTEYNKSLDAQEFLQSSQTGVASQPRITFESLSTSLPQPQVPISSNIYKLKTNYTVTEARDFAKALELAEYKENGTSIFVYNNNANDPARGWIMFDRNSGSFHYRSYGNMAPGGATPLQTAQAFLMKVGIADATVNCSVTYERTDVDGVTFVECRRDWQKVGLPILNMIGLLNVPENTRVDSLSLGMVDDNAPSDPSVINISTNQQGKKRPDDFNTATVVVGSKGNILMANSNLRKIETTMPLNGQVVLPADAWKKFQANMPDVSFVVPAGTGTLDFDRVFPNNMATAKSGNIMDYEVAYIENGKDQQYLTPMYIIRGTAQTNEGYTIKFAQGVAASKLGLTSATRSTGGEVAGESTSSAQGRESLQLEYFRISPSFQGGTSNSSSDSSGVCEPAAEQLQPKMELAGVGTIGPWTVPPFKDEVGEYYLLPSGMQPWPDVTAIVNAFDSLVLPKTEEAKLRSFDNISDELSSSCPLRISGSSPTIFIYGENSTTYSVTTKKQLTYADPSVNTNMWNVTVNENNLLTVNGVNRPYVYYEYLPIFFKRPIDGWIVSRNELEYFAHNTIASQLGLTSDETSRLVFELNHAAYGIDEGVVFVGQLSQAEIDAKLPLRVDPSLHVVRKHFYVGPVLSHSVSTPILYPLPRNDSMLLELGAAQEKE